MKTDTIAAIATGASSGGISIIRISGDKAFNVIDKIYQSKKKNKLLSTENSHTIHYGYIVDENQIIDEVMVSPYESPFHIYKRKCSRNKLSWWSCSYKKNI